MSIQIVIFVLLSTSIIFVSSLSSALSFYSTKFFNFSLASIISFAAYFTYYFYNNLNIDIYFSILLAIICCVVINSLFELMVFRYMRNKKISPFSLLIASIGLYIILQNLISIFFGDETKILIMKDAEVGHKFGGAFITDIQILIITIGVVLFLAAMLMLSKTSIGKKIRAVSDNPELSKIYAINSNQVILVSSTVSAVMVSILGILVALDLDMSPSFGFKYYLYGVVAMIIGGVGSYKGLIVASLLIAFIQQTSAIFIDVKWMDTSIYAILILFLIWKPLGFSGNKLKKIEV